MHQNILEIKDIQMNSNKIVLIKGSRVRVPMDRQMLLYHIIIRNQDVTITRVWQLSSRIIEYRVCMRNFYPQMKARVDYVMENNNHNNEVIARWFQ